MADHATNKTTNNLPGLTGERVKAGVTIVVTLYALINAGLSLAGINPLPFTDEQVSASVFGVIGIAGTVYGWWKNQNITSASLAGQQLVDALKKEGVVNGISAAKSAALSAAAAVAKTTPKITADSAESAESTDTDNTVADSAFVPGGDIQ
ncbi:Phage lysis protein, holin [Bifidobacterium pseudocatenulatum]|uniref:Phage lysis protein, holin n=1 Tax=Bifidobacterium pseudocatenulatum TaxID=28026 RepID=A0ABY6Y8G2_BIFPS|nr:phage holin [Bifidobacterium pseudocatenulatum]CAG9065197.1 Phage lysis protein, holin [Bifidobacterium pseudocatenulatum]CAG9071064.1 Phage lysis protein, holin [Bifidobacterium pseudocatenulatum]VWQ11679.1 Phage lysis protein, holin [Bifidobacterium pseudocatenulatum]VWQ11707.1 Phage lysis protein, holin [Bifidobacterium pseudocatenulatum]VWQ11722.1 Phage lysis protein, holin [Bifidobacterium pseudocatenulatum]